MNYTKSLLKDRQTDNKSTLNMSDESKAKLFNDTSYTIKEWKDNQIYEMDELLHSSNESKVYKDKSEHFVIKVLECDGNLNIASKQAIMEQKILDNTKIFELCDIFIDSNKNLLYKIYPFLSFAVDDRVQEHKDCDEESLKALTEDVCDSLVLLHKCKYIHGDIKPSNIMWCGSEEIFKLIDYETMIHVLDNEIIAPFQGTYGYTAPELENDKGKNRISDSIDIWSLGVTLIYCVTGGDLGIFEFDWSIDESVAFGEWYYELFESKDNIENELKDLYSNEYISSGLYELFQGMLKINPKERLTAEKILQCKWLNNNDDWEFGKMSSANSNNSNENESYEDGSLSSDEKNESDSDSSSVENYNCFDYGENGEYVYRSII